MQRSYLEMTPRLATVAIGGLALITLIGSAPHAHPSSPGAVAADVALAAGPAAVQAVHWDVRSGGWFIRVDGVEIPFPESSESEPAQPEAVAYRLTLSPFDELIVRHSRAHGFDWRLIAALIYEESRFDPASRSPKGAFGLMQVREIAARDVGEDRYHLPEDNVRAGVQYLAQMVERFSAAPARDRLELALAAYNGGPGHVEDAQEVARRLNVDPNRWRGGVREVMPLLERPRIHRHLAHGYAQGGAIVGYVDRIWERFGDYQRTTARMSLAALE